MIQARAPWPKKGKGDGKDSLTADEVEGKPPWRAQAAGVGGIKTAAQRKPKPPPGPPPGLLPKESTELTKAPITPPVRPPRDADSKVERVLKASVKANPLPKVSAWNASGIQSNDTTSHKRKQDDAYQSVSSAIKRLKASTAEDYDVLRQELDAVQSEFGAQLGDWAESVEQEAEEAVDEAEQRLAQTPLDAEKGLWELEVARSENIERAHETYSELPEARQLPKPPLGPPPLRRGKLELTERKFAPRKTNEQLAVDFTRKAIARIKGASCENFEILHAEMNQVLEQQWQKMGAQADVVYQEAEEAITVAEASLASHAQWNDEAVPEGSEGDGDEWPAQSFEPEPGVTENWLDDGTVEDRSELPLPTNSASPHEHDQPRPPPNPPPKRTLDSSATLPTAKRSALPGKTPGTWMAPAVKGVPSEPKTAKAQTTRAEKTFMAPGAKGTSPSPRPADAKHQEIRPAKLTGALPPSLKPAAARPPSGKPPVKPHGKLPGMPPVKPPVRPPGKPAVKPPVKPPTRPLTKPVTAGRRPPGDAPEGERSVWVPKGYSSRPLVAKPAAESSLKGPPKPPTRPPRQRAARELEESGEDVLEALIAAQREQAAAANASEARLAASRGPTTGI